MRATENEIFRDKIELSLDGKQVFYLFFGGAVVASMVFVLGVMVGKRVEARAHQDGRAVASAELDPLAALDQLDARSRSEDLAFRGALRGGASVTGLGEVDAKLVGRSAAGEPGEEPAAAPAKAEVAKVEAEAAAKARAESEASAKEAAKAKAEADAKARAEADAAAKEKEAAKAEALAKAKAEPAAKAKFTLQLSSFQDRAEAESFAATLKAGKYKPYVKEAEVEGKGTWYRVRLGGYASFDEAVAAKEAFEADQGVIAYVTRL